MGSDTVSNTKCRNRKVALLGAVAQVSRFWIRVSHILTIDFELNADDVIANVNRNMYHVACGDRDNGGEDSPTDRS